MATKARQLTNVTVTLDGATLAKARVKAAERKLSLSRFVGEVLRERMSHSREYAEAMQAALAFRPVKFSKRPLTREELYALPRRLR